MGKHNRTYIAFTYEQLIEVKNRNYHKIGREAARIRKELRGLIYETDTKKELLERLSILDSMNAERAELARQYLPRWYIEPKYFDNDDVRFKKKLWSRMKSKSEARAFTGLEEDNYKDGEMEGGSPACGAAPGCYVGNASDSQINAASTVGKGGELFKNCPHCEEEKGYQEFAPAKNTLSGRISACRPCQLLDAARRNKKLREYRKAHK